MAAAAPVAPALTSSYLAGGGTAPNTSDTGTRLGPVNYGTPAPAAAGTYMGGSKADWDALSSAPAANPYQGYIDAFNSSQEKARAGIDQALHQSMGELGGRRDAAAAVAAGLPGQVASAYNTAAGGLASNRDAATSALSPDVKGSAAALYGPLDAALQQDKAGANALGPFVGLAQRANYDAGAAQLRNSAFAANSGLDQQTAQFQQSMMMMQAQADIAAKQRASELVTSHAWDMDPNNPNSIAGRKNLADYSNTQAINAQPSADAALQGTGFSTGQVSTLRGSPEYGRFSSLIASGQSDAQMIINDLKVRNPDLLKLLEAENPAFFFGTQKVNGQDVPDPSKVNRNLAKPDLGSMPYGFVGGDIRPIFGG